MKMNNVTVTANIDAPSDAVYQVLADYRIGHPSILPKKYFRKLEVLQGGVGKGTVIRVHMTVAGQTGVGEMTVDEPQPGRVLTETDTKTGYHTTFTVEKNGAHASHVTIATDIPRKPGFAGWREWMMMPMLLKKIYREELENLQFYLQTESEVA